MNQNFFKRYSFSTNEVHERSIINNLAIQIFNVAGGNLEDWKKWVKMRIAGLSLSIYETRCDEYQQWLRDRRYSGICKDVPVLVTQLTFINNEHTASIDREVEKLIKHRQQCKQGADFVALRELDPWLSHYFEGDAYQKVYDQLVDFVCHGCDIERETLPIIDGIVNDFVSMYSEEDFNDNLIFASRNTISALADAEFFPCLWLKPLVVIADLTSDARPESPIRQNIDDVWCELVETEKNEHHPWNPYALAATRLLQYEESKWGKIFSRWCENPASVKSADPIFSLKEAMAQIVPHPDAIVF